MMQGEKTLHNFKYLFVTNNIVFNAEAIILLDLSTQVKMQLAVFCKEPLSPVVLWCFTGDDIQ